MKKKTTKPKTKTKSTSKRKTKGKRHPVFAHSLDRMARDAESKSEYTLANIFRLEANRIRTIVR